MAESYSDDDQQYLFIDDVNIPGFALDDSMLDDGRPFNGTEDILTFEKVPRHTEEYTTPPGGGMVARPDFDGAVIR